MLFHLRISMKFNAFLKMGVLVCSQWVKKQVSLQHACRLVCESEWVKLNRKSRNVSPFSLRLRALAGDIYSCQSSWMIEFQRKPCAEAMRNAKLESLKLLFRCSVVPGFTTCRLIVRFTWTRKYRPQISPAQNRAPWSKWHIHLENHHTMFYSKKFHTQS